MVIVVKIFKNEKTIEMQQVWLTEVCGKVSSEKYAYKSVKRALLLSNVIDVDHQNSCLFTNNPVGKIGWINVRLTVNPDVDMT